MPRPDGVRDMRVLVVHHNPIGALTGAQSMALATASGLEARGHSVVLHETSPGTGDAGESGVGRRRGPGRPAGWVPDIVHLVDLADPQGGWLAQREACAAGCPLVVTPATDIELWQDRAASTEIARSADAVLILTEEEGNRMCAAGVAGSRLAKIAQAPMLSGRADPQGFRKILGISGPLVLYLSRKVETKGYQHLLAAAPEILARHPLATVAFAGSDLDGTATARIAAVHDSRVIDLGVLDENEKHSALVAATILCIPSIADCFPLVFTEAWWCSTPVVTGPFPGATEVVRDSVDGRIVPAQPPAIAAAVNDLLDDPKVLARMAGAGRLRAERELGWDRVTDDIEAGYGLASRANVGS